MIMLSKFISFNCESDGTKQKTGQIEEHIGKKMFIIFHTSYIPFRLGASSLPSPCQLPSNLYSTPCHRIPSEWFTAVEETWITQNMLPVIIYLKTKPTITRVQQQNKYYSAV
ncbi:hypothetical protein AHF37_08255 [Paragonimus kellicotti]|nr:hypothetical protein AHF37_08255 [Paragonimus kellicotti]